MGCHSARITAIVQHHDDQLSNQRSLALKGHRNAQNNDGLNAKGHYAWALSIHGHQLVRPPVHKDTPPWQGLELWLATKKNVPLSNWNFNLAADSQAVPNIPPASI